MTKFKTIPQTVEAARFEDTPGSLDELRAIGFYKIRIIRTGEIAKLYITPDDYASVGDYVVKTPYGGFYSCRADAFERQHTDDFKCKATSASNWEELNGQKNKDARADEWGDMKERERKGAIMSMYERTIMEHIKKRGAELAYKLPGYRALEDDPADSIAYLQQCESLHGTRLFSNAEQLMCMGIPSNETKRGSAFIPMEGIPTEKQRKFIESTKRFALIGGGRGLGKSWAIRRDAIEYALKNDGAKVLLLRRTRGEAIYAIQDPMRIELHGTATLSLTRNEFRFANGSTIRVCWCERQEEVHKFAGEDYDKIGIDEAQCFTEYQLSFLEYCGIPRPIMRYSATLKVREDLKVRRDSGYCFLKRRFLDRQYVTGENPEDFHLIHASIKENQFIVKNMPEYAKAVAEDEKARDADDL